MIDGKMVRERPEKGSNDNGGEWRWVVSDVKRQNTAQR